MYGILGLFGPKHLGGRGDITALIEEEVSRTGGSYAEVAKKVCPAFHRTLRIVTEKGCGTQLIFTPTDKVMRLHGMVPMYDYEQYPQDVRLSGRVMSITC